MRPLLTLVLTTAALTVAPATASALSCPPPRGELAELQLSDAAFVGQVLEQREDTRVIAVLEGFKGVTTGDTVEIAVAEWPSPRLPGMPGPVLGAVVSGAPVPVVANVRDGRLSEGLCRFVGLDGLRAAAAAARQGLRCGPAPRIVWAVPTVSGRVLTLRVVVADDERRANVVRVAWGQSVGTRQNPVTTKRVPRSRTVLLRHHYARSGGAQVRVTVSSTATVPPSLCATGFAGSRFLPLRIR